MVTYRELEQLKRNLRQTGLAVVPTHRLALRAARTFASANGLNLTFNHVGNSYCYIFTVDTMKTFFAGTEKRERFKATGKIILFTVLATVGLTLWWIALFKL